MLPPQRTPFPQILQRAAGHAIALSRCHQVQSVRQTQLNHFLATVANPQVQILLAVGGRRLTAAAAVTSSVAVYDVTTTAYRSKTKTQGCLLTNGNRRIC
jgi:hypothetical protein